MIIGVSEGCGSRLGFAQEAQRKSTRHEVGTLQSPATSGVLHGDGAVVRHQECGSGFVPPLQHALGETTRCQGRSPVENKLPPSFGGTTRGGKSGTFWPEQPGPRTLASSFWGTSRTNVPEATGTFSIVRKRMFVHIYRLTTMIIITLQSERDKLGSQAR